MTPKITFGLLGCLLVGLLVGNNLLHAQPATKQQAPQTVAYVDVDKYKGTWYEIASMPMFFQRKCVSGTQAQYSLEKNDTGIAVHNQCQKQDGRWIHAKGHARVEDIRSNAKLRVSFVNFFGWRYAMGGDYWVIGLDKDYRYAIVGHPERQYGWILSRTRKLDDATLHQISGLLVNQGYDPCTFITTPQPDGLDKKQPLCQLLSVAPSNQF